MAEQGFQGKHSDLTDKTLAAFFKVHRTLGCGPAARLSNTPAR